MRFFGNNIETVVATDDLDRGFIVQSQDFTAKGQYSEIHKFSATQAKDLGYKELEASSCYDLAIPEYVLEIVGYNL